MDSIIIRRDNDYIELPIKNDIRLNKNFEYTVNAKAPYRFNITQDNTVVLNTLKDKIEMIPHEYINLTQTHQAMFFKSVQNTFELCNNGVVEVGAGLHCDVKIESKNRVDFIIESNKLVLCSGIDIFLNGNQIKNSVVDYNFGDVILANTLKFILHRNYLVINGNPKMYSTKLYPWAPHNKQSDEIREYKRSPRIIRRLPDDNINIVMPSPKKEAKKGQLAKLLLPPIVMLAVTAIITISNPKGIYILMSIAGVAVSMVVSVTSFINDKKDTKEENERRTKGYEQYLLNLRNKLNKLKNRNIDAITYNAPDIKEIENMILSFSDRIYERSIFDEDFLEISIGNGTISSSFKIKELNEKVEEKEDELIEEARIIYNLFSTIPNMPHTLNLKKTHLGIVGEKRHIHEQLNLFFIQTAFLQSYHDVEIIFVYDSIKYKDRFKWLYWLPHLKIHSINLTGVIGDEKTRDQVLGSLTKILKEREVKQTEQKKEAVFAPHYIFVIDEPTLIMDHSIMEYLQRNNADLGFSVIYTSRQRGNIPENIKSVLILRDSKNGVLQLAYGIDVNTPLTLCRMGNTNFELLSRNLAGVNHQKGVMSKIPETVTFFDLYGIKDIAELNVLKRWKENSAYKTLAVPLGFRSEGDIVELNLHEKAHGPHGLIAGTTGSGKSEIIQSYICSLATNYHPHEVGFLLIDYKGGGMAGLFKKLPHLLGTMTNLDGSQSLRAMASIKRELARRQEVFSSYGVNHINQYNKLFKMQKATQPIPHLFLISDEFAELKKEQPDFMAELISAARIGRSLGVHLILATQKPTGVVDDQIWSNSKFKLCLKVQNDADSNEILKTPDAASITLPGRAYLQVGNNEIYELFQSAWSGAKIQIEGQKQVVDDRVYVINSLGQGMLLNEDLSIGEIKTADTTQLEVLISHIKSIYKDLDCVQVEKPWLPPLKEKLVSQYINITNYEFIKNGEIDANIAIGVVDIPEKQVQQEYKIDFIKEGNLIVFSSAGFGKSTTLSTIMLSLAVKNNPKNIKFYVLDFGNAALIQMQSLPHTADYIMIDEIEKTEKLIKLLSGEMINRKKLFAKEKAANFKMYNEIAKEKIPAIFVVIDNYDVIKELGFEIEDFFTKLTRDGVGVGIFSIISATRLGAVKYATLNNFKLKIIHYMFDTTDVISLIGHPPYSIEEKKGAAYVKLEDINLMQVYLPTEYIDDISYSQNIANIVQTLNNAFPNYKNSGIKMIPEELHYADLDQYGQIDTQNCVAVGISVEEVRTTGIDINNGSVLIIGDIETGKTNMLKLIGIQIKERAKIYLFDSNTSELYEYANRIHASYIDDEEKAKEALEKLLKEVDLRNDNYSKAKHTGETKSPKQFFSAFPQIAILIEDCDCFLEYLKKLVMENVDNFLTNIIRVGIIVIATSLNSKLKGYDNNTRVFKNCIHGIILGNPNSQTVLPCSHIRAHKQGVAYGFKYEKGNIVQMQIPKCD